MPRDDSTGPLMAAVLWAVTALSGLLLCARVGLRWRRGLWWDDHIMVLSWIFLLVQTSTTQAAIRLGLGMHARDLADTYPAAQLATIAVLGRVSLLFALLASNLSKIAFAVTLLKVTPGGRGGGCARRWRAAIVFIIATLLVFMVPVAVWPWVIRCAPGSAADDGPEKHCADAAPLVKYGIFQAAYAAAADFALAMMPWRILWALEVRRVEKLGAAAAMSLGAFAGVASIIKGIYVAQLADADFSYNGKDLTIWAAVEPAVAIAAASLPALRALYHEKGSRSRSSSSKASRRLYREKHDSCGRGYRREGGEGGGGGGRADRPGHRDKPEMGQRPHLQNNRHPPEIELSRVVADTVKHLTDGTYTNRGDSHAWVTSQADADSGKSILDDDAGGGGGGDSHRNKTTSMVASLTSSAGGGGGNGGGGGGAGAGAVASGVGGHSVTRTSGILQTSTFAVEYPDDEDRSLSEEKRHSAG